MGLSLAFTTVTNFGPDGLQVSMRDVFRPPSARSGADCAMHPGSTVEFGALGMAALRLAMPPQAA